MSFLDVLGADLPPDRHALLDPVSDLPGTLDIARVDVDAHRRTGEARGLVAAPGPIACRRGLIVLALRATQPSSDERCTPLHV
jgi:hypothetical protein